MLRLLPGISSLLISTLPVHSPAFLPKPLLISPVLAVAKGKTESCLFPLPHSAGLTETSGAGTVAEGKTDSYLFPPPHSAWL